MTREATLRTSARWATPIRLPRGVPRLPEAVAYGLPASPSDEELSELGVQVGHRTA